MTARILFTTRVIDHQHALVLERIKELHALLGLGQLEEHEVGAYPLRVERQDAWEVGEAVGQSSGVDVILGEAVDHAVGSVTQRDQPGRSEDAGLAHSTAEQLPGAAGLLDKVGRADDDGSNWTGEAFREAERG